jgi:broad specificity phosphatase PhoE
MHKVGGYNIINNIKVNDTNPIYFVRHGSTHANDDGLFRGYMDYQLSDDGKEDAESVADFLSDKGIRKIVCSPLSRAIETAQIIARKVGIDSIQVDDGLLPLDVGKFAGESRKDNWKEFTQYLKDPDKTIPDGQSINEFHNQNVETFKRIADEAERDGPTVIVAHTSNVVSIDNMQKDNFDSKPESDEIIPPGGILKIEDGKSEVVHGEPGKGTFGSS